MSYHDINCPYCNHGQEINHDDGYGYEEDATHQQQCSNCDKSFTYTTSILFNYEAEKAPCLNGESDHEWKQSITCPKQYTTFYCKYCDEKRRPTPEEMEEILKSYENNT